MPLADTLKKEPGDILQSDDWNVIIKEIDRLETAKINRDGADTLKGPLTIAEALNANSNVTIKGSLSIVVPQPQDPSGQILVLGPTNASNLRLGYHQDYSWIQSHGGKPLLINRLGNNIGIGSTIDPIASLDIASASRTGTHPTAIKGLYITGDFNADNDGVEFRHSSGTQGIGFGFNTIYAAGSNPNQDLQLKPKGTGVIAVAGNLSVTNVLEIGTPPVAGNTGGNRDWMLQKGININWDSDSLFIGLKNEGTNRKDAVIAWGDDPQDDLRFVNVLAGGEVQGKELMRIKPSGNVGIGTSTPNDTLDVAGSLRILTGSNPIRFTSVWSGFPDAFTNQAEICNETNGYKTLMIVGNSSANLGRRVSIWDRLEVNGALTYWSVAQVSSRKLKKNILDISAEEAVQSLAQLNPVKYNLKADKDNNLHLGFIAEDVPDLVASRDRQTISNDHIVALLTKVIKEQEKRLLELAEKVETLEKKS